MSNPDRPPTENQLSLDLPGPKVFLTGHDESTGKAVMQDTRPVKWVRHDQDQLLMSVAYTTAFPPDLNGDADIRAHDAKMAAGPFGLATKNGTVLRFVEFAPGYTCMMHRTQSLDYGIVLEGAVECVLDGGGATLLARGDVCVQRATMHAWRNPSRDAWARMVFVLQDCQPLLVGGRRYKEDGVVDLPASGNDE